MSNQLILPNLELQGFRAFRKLRIERLGRVNLIVGKNNVGKTSILDALRLYANPSPRALVELLSTRDEFFDDSPRLRLKGSRPTPLPIEAIFHGRMAIPDQAPSISIGPIGDEYRTVQLKLTIESPLRMRPGELLTKELNGDPLDELPIMSFCVDELMRKSVPIDDSARFSLYDHI